MYFNQNIQVKKDPPKQNNNYDENVYRPPAFNPNSVNDTNDKSIYFSQQQNKSNPSEGKDNQATTNEPPKTDDTNKNNNEISAPMYFNEQQNKPNESKNDNNNKNNNEISSPMYFSDQKQDGNNDNSNEPSAPVLIKDESQKEGDTNNTVEPATPGNDDNKINDNIIPETNNNNNNNESMYFNAQKQDISIVNPVIITDNIAQKAGTINPNNDDSNNAPDQSINFENNNNDLNNNNNYITDNGNDNNPIPFNPNDSSNIPASNITPIAAPNDGIINSPSNTSQIEGDNNTISNENENKAPDSVDNNTIAYPILPPVNPYYQSNPNDEQKINNNVDVNKIIDNMDPNDDPYGLKNVNSKDNILIPKDNIMFDPLIEKYIGVKCYIKSWHNTWLYSSKIRPNKQTEMKAVPIGKRNEKHCLFYIERVVFKQDFSVLKFRIKTNFGTYLRISATKSNYAYSNVSNKDPPCGVFTLDISQFNNKGITIKSGNNMYLRCSKQGIFGNCSVTSTNMGSTYETWFIDIQK